MRVKTKIIVQKKHHFQSKFVLDQDGFVITRICNVIGFTLYISKFVSEAERRKEVDLQTA